MSETALPIKDDGYTSPDFLANVFLNLLSSSKNPSIPP